MFGFCVVWGCKPCAKKAGGGAKNDFQNFRVWNKGAIFVVKSREKRV
jgi:hypothetical protein